MIERLIGRLRRLVAEERIASADALTHFAGREAARIAQKCIMDYCSAKAGLNRETLFKEAAFLDALAVSRWESFAATLSDCLVIAESLLRPEVAGPGQRERLEAALVGCYAVRLAAERPPHRPAGWDDAVESFRQRLAGLALKAPRRPDQVAMYSARRLFDSLPIHIDLRRHDGEYVTGSVRFQFVGYHDRLARRLDAGAVAADLLARRHAA